MRRFTHGAGALLLVVILTLGITASSANMAYAVTGWAPLVPPVVGGGASGATVTVGGVTRAAAGILLRHPYVLIGIGAGAGLYYAWDRWGGVDDCTVPATGGPIPVHPGCVIDDDVPDVVPAGYELTEVNIPTLPHAGYWDKVTGDFAGQAITPNKSNGSGENYSLQAYHGYTYNESTGAFVASPGAGACSISPSFVWSGTAQAYSVTGTCGASGAKPSHVMVSAGSVTRTWLVGEHAAQKRRFRTVGECKGADGVAYPVVAESAFYTPGQAATVDIPGVQCQDGDRLTDVGVVREGNQSGLPDLPMFELPAPVEMDPGEAARLEECLNRTVNPCELHLFRKIDGAWKNCDNLGVQCAEWTRDPQRASKYECRWGPIVMNLNQCAPLRDTYNSPDRTTRPSPNPDPTTNPQPNPDTDPNPAPNPDPSLNPDPEPLPEECSSFLGAIECGIARMFEPAPSTRTRMESLPDLFTDKPPFSIFVWFDGIGGTLTDLGQQCPSWNVSIGEHNASVLCGSSFVTAMRGARPMLLAGMSVVAFSRLLWGVWYATIPILKATRSGDDK